MDYDGAVSDIGMIREMAKFHLRQACFYPRCRHPRESVMAFIDECSYFAYSLHRDGKTFIVLFD